MPNSQEIGTCPICREPLIISGGTVVCPKSHYQTSYKKWDDVWYYFSLRGDGDAEKLMKDLLALNEKKISKKKIEELQKFNEEE